LLKLFGKSFTKNPLSFQDVIEPDFLNSLSVFRCAMSLYAETIWALPGPGRKPIPCLPHR
ncbi:hypothetical protein, partial [Novacetimonas hansenii]|uniref:hypothetical protein n=1 Tax=Novacetimonas hansenii TaxID=436 RepID=UPI001A7EC411